MSDWDAARYHRLSEPQLSWGRAVIGRLPVSEGDRILDLGCGTGRLTAELAAVSGIFVTGLDRSRAMLMEAAAQGLPAGTFVQGDGAALPFRPASFDAIFSTATFHWIPDHDRLFAGIYAALKPGGRLVAQCGGGPNLARLLERTHDLMDSPEYASMFRGWSDPWKFATVDETRVRLVRAGFHSVEVLLHAAPTQMPNAAAFADFISCVCVRHHIDRLPADARPGFVRRLTELSAEDDPPFTLDYWRLNIAADKGR
jgi:trans-aconitate methyltransferase